MKILHITTNYPTIEYPIFGIFVKEQVESLQKLGLNCDVFYCDGQGKGFKKYITYIPILFRKIHRGEYDIIHCHHALSAVLLYLTGIPLFGRKNIILSYQSDPINEWGANWFWRFYKRFKAFIVKNRSEYLAYPKVHYLPNGCNQDFFRPKDKEECRKKLGWGADKIYIIWMDSNKGVRTMKRRDRFDATLDLLHSKYGYRNIEPVIMRNIPREEIPDYLNACDLHLMSSDFEGSPNSVKECMCCNTPVVTTPVGNVKEMIGDIPGCVITSEFTPEALAEGCDKVLKNKEPFNGRELFLAKGYGMAIVAERLVELYKQMLNQ